MRQPGWSGSLRGRLTLGTLALLAVGLLAGDVTAYLAVQTSLTDRVDRNLAVVAARARVSAAGTGVDPLTAGTVDRLMPADVYLAFYDDSGRRVLTRDTVDAAVGDDDLAGRVSDDPVTFAGSDGGVRAMSIVLAQDRPLRYVDDDGMTYDVTRLVVGISRADDVATLRRLVQTEVASGVTILLLMLLASRLVLRAGLAPLRTVAETARGIAGGDLATRIPETDPHTEIGAVSTALNAAFDQREASEGRLRRFVADASHELRTPLSTIHGWADLYANGGIDDWDGVDSAMTNIIAQSQRMGSLVDQLLTLARLDAHEPLRLADVDLTALCAQTVADLQVSNCSHRVSIVAEDSVWVRADEGAMRRVVDNLLSNAVLHTPAGTEVEVHVSSRPVTGAKLRVVDHGPGLTREQLTRAFDRFWRADAQRSTPEGTGLGLAIARDLVLAHGGSIHLSATPGGGLTVAVELEA